MQPRPPRSPGFFTAAPPRVLAHRGLAIGAPENTLLAFAKAVAVGVTHIETDVHASSDGIAVISHDPDLSRLLGRDTRVSELTMAQLGRLELGNGQVFSSLAEALDGFPETRFNIDVKSADAVEPTIRAIRAANATSRVLVTSFSERRRAAAVRDLPGVASSASAPLFGVALVAGKLGLSSLLRLALRNVDAVQIPERAAGMNTVTPRQLRLVHAAGIEVHVWTVNDVPTMTRLLDLGVDGLVTDRADLAMELLRSGI
ncbi:glycerophosphodiester phosphodiesterase family protein [Parafrigoribacterium soli]|uniref:glycerophosphodiester phosphodiesterase family protein n=1 Tax=Parafrigoribacterium soli TaxID=3144663 RepID=UPI0032EF2284